MNWKLMHNFFTTTTARLALSYLAIIMLMSIGFSVVFYHTTSHELGRQLPPFEMLRGQRLDDSSGFSRPVNDFLENRINEGRQVLLERLILVNILALILGGVLSYLLAERTLRPIKSNLEAQEQFVSDASHELRTPLTALLTTNEVALRRKKITDADARAILQDNVSEVAKLQALTNSLLRLARQERGGLRLTTESLQDIAVDAINRVVKQAQKKDISVHDNIPDMAVLAEKDGLVQAVTIILDNAIKYSSSGTSIGVIGSRQGKYAVLKIQDEGAGISASDLPFIFDRFYRADQSRNKQQVDGYGIGLALAKKVIEQHRGEISVKSEEGVGTVFTIKLPLAKE